jgi:ribonuclease BN (tRNA processing enzyme)
MVRNSMTARFIFKSIVGIAKFLLIGTPVSIEATASPTLTIIGSGTCMPLPHRKAPGNLVSDGNTHFLVDSGPGTLQSLAAQGFDTQKLCGVFYTHFHSDHIGDLVNIITWLWVRACVKKHNDTPDQLNTFTIHGPIGLIEYVKNLTRYAFIPPLLPFVKLVEIIPGQELSIGSINATTYKVPHTAESIGYRFAFSNGKTLAISGDTAYGNEVVDLISNVDVAVLECSYDDEYYEKTKHEVNHLSPTTAAHLATQAQAKTLVLTHLYPSADAIDIAAIAQKSFDGAVVTARDGMIIPLA